MNKDKRIRQLAVTVPTPTGGGYFLSYRVMSNAGVTYHPTQSSWERVERLINSGQYSVHYNTSHYGITVHVSRRSSNVS